MESGIHTSPTILTEPTAVSDLCNDNAKNLTVILQNMNRTTINVTGDGGESLMNKVAMALDPYYVYGLIVFGVAGNALSALVFLRSPLRSRSSSFYLASLAMVDLLFLLQLAIVYYPQEDGSSLINQDGGCQALSYFSSVFTSLSIWFIVGFTAERFIAVQFPLHRPQMCTASRAKRIIATLTLISLILNSYVLVVAVPTFIDGTNATNHVVNPTEANCTVATVAIAGTFCGVNVEFTNFNNVCNIIDTLLTHLIPLALIVVMNSMIIRQLYASSLVHTAAPPMLSLVQAVSPPISRCKLSSSIDMTNNHNNHHNNNHQRRTATDRNGRRPDRISAIARALSRASGYSSGDSFESVSLQPEGGMVRSNILYQRAQRQITKMLLLISTVFVALNLPSYVIRLYFQWFIVGESSESLSLAQNYAMMLFYTNFSINFLLYSAYGRTFRKALASLLCDCCGRSLMS